MWSNSRFLCGGRPHLSENEPPLHLSFIPRVAAECLDRFSSAARAAFEATLRSEKRARTRFKTEKPTRIPAVTSSPLCFRLHAEHTSVVELKWAGLPISVTADVLAKAVTLAPDSYKHADVSRAVVTTSQK